MRILIIGNGGREHALCWKLAKSPIVSQIFTAPGNPGTARVAKNQNVPLASDDIDALLHFASGEGIDLTVVGPEKPLSDGIVDRFQSRRLAIFGPSKEAAKLEWSKGFAKEIMASAGIPTSAYSVFRSLDEALSRLPNATYPIVLKADGLAAGKGVAICSNQSEAQAFARQVMGDKLFGAAGSSIVAEEFLEGEEASFLVIASGTDYLPLASAQDHKRLLDKDEGPNTGGMGAYSPAPVFTTELQRRTEKEVVEPLLHAMTQRSIPFTGVLYVGLMITSSGPKVLEFNARFGDPETQVILPRLQSDLAEIFLAASRGKIGHLRADWTPESALTVVLASEGYPMKPKSGARIEGADEASRDALVFHAGTRSEGEHLVTSGGRVFAVTGLGNDLGEAQKNAYAAVDKIRFQGKTFRTDIGWRALGAKEKS